MLERLTEWLAGSGADDLTPTRFGFNAPLPWFACLLLIAAAGVGMAVYYWRRLDGLEKRLRVFLVCLRVAVIVLVLFIALDPSVVAERFRPGEQFVLLLFDDSQSMKIEGQSGQSRGERLLESYGAVSAEFEGSLRRKHQVARYRLGAGIEPLQSMSKLEFDQRESDLTGGVAQAFADMEGAHVSAIIAFSDGVYQTSNDFVAIEDVPDSAPVFTVGVDSESNWRDIELGRISVSRTDFDKSPVVLDVDIHSTGLAGREALVEAAVNGARVVKSERITISEDDQDQQVRLEFIPDRPGWLEYEARVSLIEVAAPVETPEVAIPEDRIKENNARRFVVDNRDKEYQILYVSGRPNWENKFVRNALEEDKQLKMTTLICISTAARKFEFRGRETSVVNPLFEGFSEDVDSPRYDEAQFVSIGENAAELKSGYPITVEELFEYDLIIWGDIEKAYFNNTQMEVTRDYVEKRGGNLLILGGPKSFTNGEYSGTLLEGMLPVVLYEASDDPSIREKRQFTAYPTIEGRLGGSWSLDADELSDTQLWQEMPRLFGLDLFPLLRPGATVLAEARLDGAGEEAQPLFALQRYGEGKCAILATSDTWQWQMRLDTEDDRHERLWRQVVRNLVHDTPESTFLRGKQDAYAQGAPVDLDFVICDETFDRREGLRTSVTLTTPNNQELALSVDESIQEAGLYSSRFTPEETGVYNLVLSSLNEKDETVGTLSEAFLVEPDRREFQMAQHNPDFLRELAESTGGELVPLGELAALAQRIPLPERDDADELLLHIWHLPGFYVALVIMLALEWYLRRRRGRA